MKKIVHSIIHNIVTKVLSDEQEAVEVEDNKVGEQQAVEVEDNKVPSGEQQALQGSKVPSGEQQAQDSKGPFGGEQQAVQDNKVPSDEQKAAQDTSCSLINIAKASWFIKIEALLEQLDISLEWLDIIDTFLENHAYLKDKHYKEYSTLFPIAKDIHFAAIFIQYIQSLYYGDLKLWITSSDKNNPKPNMLLQMLQLFYNQWYIDLIQQISNYFDTNQPFIFLKDLFQQYVASNDLFHTVVKAIDQLYHDLHQLLYIYTMLLLQQDSVDQIIIKQIMIFLSFEELYPLLTYQINDYLDILLDKDQQYQEYQYICQIIKQHDTNDIITAFDSLIHTKCIHYHIQLIEHIMRTYSLALVLQYIIVDTTSSQYLLQQLLVEKTKKKKKKNFKFSSIISSFIIY